MTTPTRGAINNWLIGFLLLLVGMLSYRFLIEKTSLFGSSVVSRPVTPRGDLADDEKSTVELFNNASPSVVSVTTAQFVPDRRRRLINRVDSGEGSGVVWDKDGHIITNFHVIASAIAQQKPNGEAVFGSCRVTLADGSAWDAQIHSFAPEFDIAVLKLIDTPPSRLTPLAIGTSRELQVGQKVFAIGSPFGLHKTLTTGIISGLGRNLRSDDDRQRMDDMIQTDAAINPGNSGGPLLDSAGRMIGVNTLIFSPGTASSGVGQNAGVGFAVPIDTVNIIVPELIRGGYGTRPGLGISLYRDEDVRAQIPDFKGAIVKRVALGSTSFLAGLQPNDIVVAIDGESIDSARSLVENLAAREIGDSVTLTVERGSQEVQIPVTVQAILDTTRILGKATPGTP